MPVTASFSNLIECSFPETGSVNLTHLRSLLLALINHLQLYDINAGYDETAKNKGIDELAGEHSIDSVIAVNEDGGGRSAPDKSEAQHSNLKSFLKRKIVDQIKEEDMSPKAAVIVKELEIKVSDIEKKLKAIEMWPKTEELISRSRQPSKTPFSDWWNMSNLAKRMEASEESLSKFASAIEELSRKVGEKRDTTKEKSDEMKEDEQHKQDKSSLDEGLTEEKLAEILEKTNRKVAEIRKELCDLTTKQNNILTITESFPVESLPDILEDLSQLKSWVNKMETKMQPGDFQEEINDQIREHTEKLNEMNMNLINQRITFQAQITDIEKELGILNERFNTQGPASEALNDDETFRELKNKLQGLQEEIENLNETTIDLISGQKERESNIKSLLEQVQLIKNVKADKEGLEDALAEKADAFSVNRKVSHDQFDAAYYELNRSIIDAQARLGCQEQAWISAIAEIQKDIGEKLDKIEMAPLQQVIDDKLRQLEDKVKAMSERKKDSEACGTKKKLIRNINCISCDERVAMKTKLKVPLLPVLDSITPNRSMRPYLTYELDHIRKELKSLHCLKGSNLGKTPDDLSYKDYEFQSQIQDVGHYCSRYCGGSHTMITNEQRVRRVGHFTEENIDGMEKMPQKKT